MQSNLMLLFAAAIWGFGFVAQRLGMNYLEPFAFNAARFLLGSLSLIPLIWWLYRLRKSRTLTANIVVHASHQNQSSLTKAGVVTGSILFIAATFQQFGLVYTTAAKAGFITGLYLILVPILGILLKHTTGMATWLGAALALSGLYLLSINDDFTMSTGDMLLSIGALFWALHILTIDHFSGRVDPIQLSAVQFALCGVASLGVSLFIETPSVTAAIDGWRPILYAGLVSVGLAYTLQVIAQVNAKPAHAAIIMSLEAVFAAIGGVWLLDETLSMRAWLGCGLMMAGMLLSQIRWDTKRNSPSPTEKNNAL
ncbi:MAG: DMT family transporter [Moraxellaceae bacterium]|nr:MAG: DMT family transporter [Moraxellaceae bacterium]